MSDGAWYLPFTFTQEVGEGAETLYRRMFNYKLVSTF